MDASAIADSTDWLRTPLAGLAPLESSLRCRVCKDFFTTPMITSCSHTFCSLCIRRYLSQEGRCPACREQDQEMKLRRNWVVEELVANFNASRKALLDFARESVQRSQDEVAGEKRHTKRRKTTDTREAVGVGAPERRSTRSQTRRIASQASASQQSLVSTQDDIADSDQGSVYEDQQTTSHHFDGPSASAYEPNDGLVACPSCSRRMKESLINAHLDKCLAGEAPSGTPPLNTETSSQSPSRRPQILSGAIAYTQTKHSSSSRLPTLNYSLLNDNALRKKLKELGIPNTGSKELMKKRHMEWLNLWNANCDSLNPVPKMQLLKDLNTWERTLGRQVERGQQPNGVMVKEFDRERYAKKQKSEFDDLIAKARQNQAAKKSQQNATQNQSQNDNPNFELHQKEADKPTQPDDGPLSSQSSPGARTLSENEENTANQDTEARAPSLPGPDNTIPAFDWTSRPPVPESETEYQPPPSSQRSMNHDITA